MAASERAHRAERSGSQPTVGEARPPQRARGRSREAGGRAQKAERKAEGLRDVVASLAAEVRRMLDTGRPATGGGSEARTDHAPAGAPAAPPQGAGPGGVADGEANPPPPKDGEEEQTPERLRERGRLLRAAASAVGGALRDQLLQEADTLQAEERALRPTGERLRAVHRAMGDHEAKVANLTLKISENQKEDAQLDAELEVQLEVVRARFAKTRAALRSDADRLRGQLDVHRTKLADLKRTAAALAGHEFATDAGVAGHPPCGTAGAAPRWGNLLLVDPATLSAEERRAMADFIMAAKGTTPATGAGNPDTDHRMGRTARQVPPADVRASGRRGTSPARSTCTEHEDDRSRSDRRGPPSEHDLEAADCSTVDGERDFPVGPDPRPGGDPYVRVASPSPTARG